MKEKTNPAIEAEERAQEVAEAALHDEVNRLTLEHRTKTEAAEAAQRRENSDRAIMNRRKAKRERRKLMFYRLALCAALAVLAASWGKFGIIPVSAAVWGVIIPAGLAALEFRVYSAHKGWRN